VYHACCRTPSHYQVDSITKADSMWFFPMLRAYDFRAPPELRDPQGDHVRVAADLSDLSEVIEWCKSHDEQCEQVRGGVLASWRNLGCVRASPCAHQCAHLPAPTSAQIAKNASALYASVVAREGQLDYLQLLVWEISARFRSTAAGGGSGGVADAVSGSGTSAVVPLAPSICESPPDCAGGDWFGIGSRRYASVRIGGSTRAALCAPEYATAACKCPHCESARSAMLAAASTASAPSALATTSLARGHSSSTDGEDGSKKRKREHLVDSSAGAGAIPTTAATQAVARAVEPKVSTERRMQAIAERAALAKAMAAADAAAKPGK
jgi:hypothetical protein